MTPEQWKRIRSWLDDALKLPPEQRTAFVEEVCANDPTVRRELLGLIRQSDSTGSMFRPLDNSGAGITNTFQLGELVLNRFRILRFVGRGGMGEVYEAEDQQLGRVALKTVRPDIASSPYAMARFRQEIRLARKVTDSHVCRIHELLESGDKVFLTMEYLEAETLSARIERDGPLPESEAKEVVRQLLTALTAAHEAGVIHRDLKSGNVMLTKRPDGGLRLVVTDFGLACEVHRDEQSLTVTGAVMGTPDYMAPEQFVGGEITPAADIYALGVLLYELLTGVRPFQAATPLGAAVVRAKRPPAVSTLREGILGHWDAVISRCLEYEPEKRWSSAREVQEALFAPDAAARSAAARKWSARSTLAAAILTTLLTSTIVWSAIWYRHRSGGPTNSDSKQLVVLPFENPGADPSDQALCDGLLEILTSAASETSALQKSFSVIPANDVRHDHIRSIQDARRQFNANLALTGSVMRSGDTLQVAINLSDTAAKRQLASRIVQARRDDTAGLQARLLSAVLELLQLQMQPKARTVIAEGTNNSAAFDLYLKGQGYLRRFNGPPSLEQAVSLLEKAVALDPSYALARAALAEAYFSEFEETKDAQWLARADAESTQSAKLNGGLPQVHATQGMILRGTGQNEKAAAEFRKAIDLDAANVESQRLLARTLEDLGRPSEAEEVYLAAIRNKPSYWPTARSLGTFYFRKGEYSKAEPWMKLVTELAPENAGGPLNLGILYYATRRYKEAEAALKKSISLQPIAVAYTDLGTVQYFQGRFAESVGAFEKAVQLGSKDPNNWGNLADAFRQLPARVPESAMAYSKAVQLARQQLGINPTDANVRSKMALYLARLGKRQESLDEIGVALQSKASNVNIPFNAAQVYELAGDHAEALRFLKEAVARGYPVDEALNLPEFKNFRDQIMEAKKSAQ